MSTPPPTAEAQLVFLAKLQRLFSEGDFTATYKFALLIALADLAVEQGADNGDALELTTRQIGERFIQQYWRQATVYGTGRPGTEAAVLVQNLGDQAAIVSAIAEFRKVVSASTPQVAAVDAGYGALLAKVTATVSAQPLNYLQNFGGGTDEFIYERSDRGRVRLKPGVAYCLRRFQPLIQQLARSHWLDHLKGNRRNRVILGDADDLEDFLFGTSRTSLLAMAVGLRKIDGDRCFYCGDTLTKVDVDHFIPFAHYPRDLAHNFVLAHPTCNRSKSDTLAARVHLERWLGRLARSAERVAEVGSDAGFVVDADACHRVASWDYASALVSGSSAWESTNSYERVDDRYMKLIEQHA